MAKGIPLTVEIINYKNYDQNQQTAKHRRQSYQLS